MFSQYYQQQISHLRKRAAEFASTHPAIAPLLAEASEDPDVERLLEGTAFLCGILQQKLDDDFPEFIQGLTEIIFPHLLRPIPSASIVAFTPKESLLETIVVPIGTKVLSKPVEGTICEFKTCMDVRLLPMRVIDAGSRRISTSQEIVFVKLQLSGITFSQWNEDSLRFYIAGDFAKTSEIFMKLTKGTKKIVVRTSSGQTLQLGPQHLKTPGFESSYNLCPMPNQTFRGYSLLIDYFAFPEKFMFLELTGLKSLSEKGAGDQFDIEFILNSGRSEIEIRKEYFTLYATPVVNLFSHDAEPIQVTHKTVHYPVYSSGVNKDNYCIYKIDSVSGFLQGMVERRAYAPFNRFWSHDQDNSGVFQVHRSRRLDGKAGNTVSLSLSYPAKENVLNETLSIEMTCTNGSLAERLRVGDICMPSSNSPLLATFKNIVATTTYIDIVTEKNELWQLMSHVSLNLLSIDNAESLREFLRMYTFESQRADQRATANKKRVNSVEKFTTASIDRIIRGILMRGIQVNVTAAENEFASLGDLYLFGSVLNAFLSMYSSMNTFTQLQLNNSQTGELFLWPPRIGEKPLL